jgi:hypothetical protein
VIEGKGRYISGERATGKSQFHDHRSSRMDTFENGPG